jgi:hypothetical protein
MVSLAALTVICALGVLGLSLWFVPAYRRFQEKRILTCPETKAAAVVQMDAGRFAATSLFTRPTVRVRDCSRWPARAGCDQACVAGIEGGRD